MSTLRATSVSVTTGLNLLLPDDSVTGAIADDSASPAARALVFRQSLHSVAGLDPKENPLNFLPHCGQTGIRGFLPPETGKMGRTNSAHKVHSHHVEIQVT